VDGFRVDINSLREMAKDLTEAADDWTAAATIIGTATMNHGTLGVLGDRLGLPDKYNNAVATMVRTMGKGTESLDKAAAKLIEVATSYEHTDTTHRQAFTHLDNAEH
jgi:hypothetical protein